MFLHDLKVAYRSLLKYKLQTVISVLSLAIGLSCFAILNTNLRRWLMGDRRLPNVNEIYFLAPETMGGWVKIDRNIYVDICDKFPEIKAVTSVLKTNNLSYLSISKNEEESYNPQIKLCKKSKQIVQKKSTLLLCFEWIFF